MVYPSKRNSWDYIEDANGIEPPEGFVGPEAQRRYEERLSQ
jgi:hypothetical protein